MERGFRWKDSVSSVIVAMASNFRFEAVSGFRLLLSRPFRLHRRLGPLRRFLMRSVLSVDDTALNSSSALENRLLAFW